MPAGYTGAIMGKPGIGGGMGGSAVGGGGNGSVEIIIPNDCVGLVIGRGGDVIKMLQAQSGARIQVRNGRKDRERDRERERERQTDGEEVSKD